VIAEATPDRARLDLQGQLLAGGAFNNGVEAVHFLPNLFPALLNEGIARTELGPDLDYQRLLFRKVLWLECCFYEIHCEANH
jgi:hypothetical protein